MSAKDSDLNQDLSVAKSPTSKAHLHLQSDSTEVITTNQSEEEKLNRLGMESARRASNRFAKNSERIPTDTMFTK
jgi:hypothetical protein